MANNQSNILLRFSEGKICLDSETSLACSDGLRFLDQHSPIRARLDALQHSEYKRWSPHTYWNSPFNVRAVKDGTHRFSLSNHYGTSTSSFLHSLGDSKMIIQRGKKGKAKK